MPGSCIKASFMKEAELDHDARRVGGEKVGNSSALPPPLSPRLAHLLFGVSRICDLKIAVRLFGNLYEGVVKAKPFGNM